jgi:peptidyl-prolyl cis-trans isomerase SurA
MSRSLRLTANALLCCGLIAALGGAVTTARAQGDLPGASVAPGADGPRLVDRIVAIVDEEVILQSDVERELELYRMEAEYSGQPVPEDTPELRRELLDRLIESKLIIAAAKQADMVVEEDAIDENVDERIQQLADHLGSREALLRELKRSGLTLEDYRSRAYNQIRDDMYLRLVVGRFIRPKVEVLENEVEEYYLDHLAEMPQEPDSLVLRNILVAVKPAPEVREKIQRKVRQAREALAAGQSFADVARKYSEGPNAARGGAVGLVRRGDLFDPALDQTVFSLVEGEVSQPVVSPRGVHLFRLDAIDEDGRRAISQIFFPMEVTDADVQAARDRIDSARERVLAGEPFSLVAEEVSEDPSSARNGGLLGTFALSALSEQFRAALADAQPGDLTEPLLAPAGWYVFMVQERLDGHMYTYDELKDELRRQLEARALERELSAYVADLRTRFFVDEKG